MSGRATPPLVACPGLLGLGLPICLSPLLPASSWLQWTDAERESACRSSPLPLWPITAPSGACEDRGGGEVGVGLTDSAAGSFPAPPAARFSLPPWPGAVRARGPTCSALSCNLPPSLWLLPSQSTQGSLRILEDLSAVPEETIFLQQTSSSFASSKSTSSDDQSLALQLSEVGWGGGKRQDSPHFSAAP